MEPWGESSEGAVIKSVDPGRGRGEERKGGRNCGTRWKDALLPPETRKGRKKL